MDFIERIRNLFDQLGAPIWLISSLTKYKTAYNNFNQAIRAAEDIATGSIEQREKNLYDAAVGFVGFCRANDSSISLDAVAAFQVALSEYMAVRQVAVIAANTIPLLQGQITALNRTISEHEVTIGVLKEIITHLQENVQEKRADLQDSENRLQIASFELGKANGSLVGRDRELEELRRSQQELALLNQKLMNVIITTVLPTFHAIRTLADPELNSLALMPKIFDRVTNVTPLIEQAASTPAHVFMPRAASRPADPSLEHN